MVRNFKEWNNKKEIIDKFVNDRVFFHEREIWWCSLGVNIGFEQDGKGKEFSRPILILKKFNKEVFWALPVTTKNKKGKFYEPVFLEGDVDRVVILSQLRLLDGKRLIDKIGTISQENYNKIQKSVIGLFNI